MIDMPLSATWFRSTRFSCTAAMRFACNSSHLNSVVLTWWACPQKLLWFLPVFSRVASMWSSLKGYRSSVRLRSGLSYGWNFEGIHGCSRHSDPLTTTVSIHLVRLNQQIITARFQIGQL